MRASIKSRKLGDRTLKGVAYGMFPPSRVVSYTSIYQINKFGTET